MTTKTYTVAELRHSTMTGGFVRAEELARVQKISDNYYAICVEREQELVALREELESHKTALREEMKDAFEFQQKNAALIELLRETSDYLDGSTRNSVWCDSILHKKMKAAIPPVESGASA